MRELFYEPYLDEYKTPTGAVQVNSDFSIRIAITERDDIERVYFVLTKDNESPMYYEMQGDGLFYCIKMKVESSGLYFYHFQVRQYGGRYFNIFSKPNLKPDYHYGRDWVMLAYEKSVPQANWLKGGLIYQIMVDRFCSVQRRKTQPLAVYRDDWYGVPEFLPNEKGKILNNDFFGGKLKGVESKLSYLKKLGVTCIYLNPIFKAKSNHKYDTGDYSMIDEDFGSEEDLISLIKKAKDLGIRIMLDGVFSHTGDDSLYFNKYNTYPSVGAYQSKDSPYYGWYTFKDYPDEYDCWWGIDILPNVNETNPNYNEYINGENGIIAKYTAMGIGGWRLDVADELPDSFIKNLTARAKATNPEALVLGEVWEDASTKTAYGIRREYFWGKELESVTNYPLKNAIIAYAKEANATALNTEILKLVDHYPSHVLNSLMNMLGTHDTVRILTALSSDKIPQTRKERAEYKISDLFLAKKRLMLCASLQYTLPGVPCVYYGDEVGLEGYEDPFNRRCYPWGCEDEILLSHYKNLGKMRKKWSKIFAEGKYKPLKSEGGILEFERNFEGKKLRIIANASEFSYELPIFTADEITNEQIKEIKPCTVAVIEVN